MQRIVTTVHPWVQGSIAKAIHRPYRLPYQILVTGFAKDRAVPELSRVVNPEALKSVVPEGCEIYKGFHKMGVLKTHGKTVKLNVFLEKNGHAEANSSLIAKIHSHVS